MSQRILIVDDDTDALEVYKTRLDHGGFEVETAESAEKALSRLAKVDPGLVITDVRMSGMTGLELLEKLRTSKPEVSVVIMTGHEDMDTAVSAMKAGAFDFLVKPVDPKALQALAERCFRERELLQDEDEPDREEDEAEEPRGSMVGSTPPMIDIYKTIGRLARNRATVLVRGETGTGKEVVARAIHAHSAHSDDPFVAVNCTALADTLLESELFGHTKGAFTGASASRKGYFELAGEGTIFLDEIGDTSPDFQTKLLRVLQERQFYPVGGEEPRDTEARVIAATHQPLEELVRNGKFREDLFFRLQVVEILVPALRDRLDDVPLLADALLARIRRETDRDVRRISDNALDRLQEYDWPGNVRELENALMRAALLARGTIIGPDHLVLGQEEDQADDLSLRTAMHRHVGRVMKLVDGDEERAARLLAIPEDELQEHLGAR